MAQRVLVVNAGSSSLKFKLFDWLPNGVGELAACVTGLLERVGQSNSTVTVQVCAHTSA